MNSVDHADQTSEEYEQEQERKHFCRIVNAFKSYKKYMILKVEEKEKYIKTLPPSHQSFLDAYVRHLDELKTCIIHNAEIIKLIVKDVESMFENVKQTELEDPHANPDVLSSDLEKIQSTFKHIARDWSEAGESERKLCYGPIIEQVEKLFPPDKLRAEDINILVPGAGLGRLSYEFAKRGYTCQGNEFSLYMLFSSNFVLNRLRGTNSLQIYPWAHCGSNLWTNSDQKSIISFPDVDPSDLPQNSQFTMAAGDFLEIYKEEGVWDCVATCFFIDCANNIVAFIETIYKILKPGGHWVNLGPLLYHFADLPGENSIEPSYEVVKQIITSIGFKILEEKPFIRSTYTQHSKSMLNYEYSSVFFSAQKPHS
ncbi:UNVERIFIED_CONTAM: hypothetical protein RMT77_015860 [Armadillidium vulgare]|nr:Carnosine N-methyltransferase [Armadillidium vulgare]